MVQSIDNISKPVYSAVNIHITKPEINARNNNNTTLVNDNGIYNSVKIDIDNPTINTEPKIYDYPQNDNIVTYDMIGVSPIALPEGFPVASYYEESGVVIPEEIDEVTEENNETEQINDKAQVPPPNYTTLEAEKGEEATAIAEKSDESTVQFKAAPESVQKKTPEVIPAEEIKPEVDISAVINNLESDDFDIQAQQMEEIARVSLEEPKKAIPYIIKDVFSNLIKITNKDTLALPAPSEKQIEIRKKIITNVISAEIAKEQNKPVQLPYSITEEEMALANEISPMEQAERNKEYAIYTIAILAKVYTDEIQQETGNVVPFTDVPGVSDIVNSLRFNPNPGVKSAAIDGLKHISRPEYNSELNTIFSIAQNDSNPQVSKQALRAKEKINQ